MGAEVVELFVPISLFFVVGMVVVSFFYFRYKSRLRAHDTIEMALEKGAELTPELIDRMISPPKGTEADLRRGVIALFIGVAFASLGLIIGEEEAIRPLLGVSMFPILIGLAYLLLWRFANKEVKAEDYS